MKDWDTALSNMGHVSGSEKLPAHWAEEAAAYRDRASVEIDISYGDAPRQRLDIVWPEGTPKGLAVYVHGGYWMRLAKSDWTQFAEGARTAGWAVAIPSYTLAPQARIAEMKFEIAAALAVAAERVAGPIRLSGHSAGGHLVTRMLCEDSPLAAGLRERIEHVLSISGLHDLRPLLRTKMNETLRLDMAEASAESPILHRLLPGTPITAWVGGGELPEFVRQSKLLPMVWESLDADAALVVDGNRNHFTVIEGLKDPESPITRAFIG